MPTDNDSPELQRLLDSDLEEPIVVNPAPPDAATRRRTRRVRFKDHGHEEPIFDERKYHRFTLEHVNADKWAHYRGDLFHTLVNARTPIFLAFFLSSYLAMYAFYAVIYRTQPDHCIFNTHTFWHAMWFSVITSATIGFGYQSPDPDCFFLNATLTAQVLTGLLMQAALLGLVYSRFASPGRRALTIKFSSIMTCYRGGDGLWRLAFRVANLRRHQVLHPDVSLLLIRRESTGGPGGPLEYRYHHLPVQHVSGHHKIWLGMPSIVVHVITEGSLLYGATPESLEGAEGLEFVALLDGIDETTSTAMQARHSYRPEDIRWGQSFAGVLSRAGSGHLAADYSAFDATRWEEGLPGGSEVSSAAAEGSGSAGFDSAASAEPAGNGAAEATEGGSGSSGAETSAGDVEQGVAVGPGGGKQQRTKLNRKQTGHHRGGGGKKK